MNSLRTDDILGAKPRVRHMPKNLIRERQIPTSFLLNMESNPEWNQKPSYYDQEPQGSRYSPVQYQNNDLNGYPFYARNRLTKEPRFTNYDFTKVQPSDLKERYQNDKSRQPQLMRVASQNRSFDEIKKQERGIQNDEATSPIYLHRSDNGKRQELNRSVQIQSRKSEDENSKRSNAQSRRSMDSKEGSQARQSRNIFRGLGFNIISNHKYQYVFEYNKAKQQG